MTTFEDRERAFEAKYAYDEEFRFRLAARRDKLFARWAAEQLRLPDDRSEELVKAALTVPDGDEHDGQLVALVHRWVLINGGHRTIAELNEALQEATVRARVGLIEHPSSFPS